MPKILSMAGLVVAALVLLVFLLDIAVGIPFGGTDKIMCVSFIIASGILGYISWNAWREVS